MPSTHTVHVSGHEVRAIAYAAHAMACSTRSVDAAVLQPWDYGSGWVKDCDGRHLAHNHWTLIDEGTVQLQARLLHVLVAGKDDCGQPTVLQPAENALLQELH
jgi:hypothetical protein